MMHVGRIKKSVPLFLVLGILVVCIGFLIVSCGTNPQQKVETITGGAYSLDFSDCPAPGGNVCYVVNESNVFKRDSNKTMAGKELTAEAWVNLHSASASGAVFGRLDSSGIMLFVNSGVPKAVVRRVTGAAPATATTDMIVGDLATALTARVWTHLAAVLSFPTSSTSKLDLYVDGQLADTQTVDENANTVARSEFTEPSSDYMTAGFNISEFEFDGLAKKTIFNGLIDETRLWGVARTQSEIQACMSVELGLDGSTCGRMTNDLIGYYRFNEGSAHTVNEWTGLGTAVKEYVDPNSSNDPPVESWNSGWTSGAPISARD